MRCSCRGVWPPRLTLGEAGGELARVPSLSGKCRAIWEIGGKNITFLLLLRRHLSRVPRLECLPLGSLLPFSQMMIAKKHPSKSIRSFSPNRGQFPVCPTRARLQSERASASVIAPLWLNGARAVTRRVQIFMPFPPFPSSPTLTAVDQTTQDTNLASPPH